jgi:hypothetical protein
MLMPIAVWYFLFALSALFSFLTRNNSNSMIFYMNIAAAIASLWAIIFLSVKNRRKDRKL